MRKSARAIVAVGILAGLALPAAMAAPAAASAGSAVSAQAARAAGGAGARGATAPPAVAITSMNPPYATAGVKVTVKGSFTNTSSAPISGVTIQLRSSSNWFTSRDELAQYSAGADPAAATAAEPGALAVIPGAVAPGATAQWTAVLPADEVHMTAFGVYPLAAQATDSLGTALSTSWSFLPYWPVKGEQRPVEDIAWIWPLIDAPAQGPCPGLLNNHLSASLTGTGRLAGLLGAGTSADGKAADLTWVVDPALLSGVQAMTRPGGYQVDSSRSCKKSTTEPTSKAAAAWLSGLQSAVSGQPAFVTPYADVDIAALTRSNLAGDLRQAFSDGRSVAAQVLRRSFTPTASAPGHETAASLISAAAWPADGLADYTMLEDLAAVNGIRTVVLSSSAMPPLTPPSYTPSAVATTPDGEGGDMRVLLADATLTQVLSSATRHSDPRGATFAANQRFLAETAMIAAQAPQLPRAIVVAPPRHWDPSAGLASGLLSDTVSAPWLSPVSAGTLAAQRNAPGQVARQQPDNVGSQVLGRWLMRRVKSADRGVQQVESMQVTPNPQLRRAVAGIESSAWRSAAERRRSRAMLSRVTAYVSRQENGVSIIGPGRVTLGGLKGSVPVSIDNRLNRAVNVRVAWNVRQQKGGGFTVLTRLGVIRVPANIVVTRKLQVRAAGIGSTTVNLRLLAPNGDALPGRAVNMTVQATHFGTLALVVLAGALAVFMITSATRGIRRGKAAPGSGPESAGGEQAQQDAPIATGTSGHEQPEGTDNVGHDRAESGEAGTDHVPTTDHVATTDHVLTEDADDYAPVPGWADRS